MKKFKRFIDENRMYDATTKADFIADDKKVIEAFLFNFFGTLALYQIAKKRDKIMRLIRSDLKLKVSDISDDNNDMSLSVKLMHDKGFFKTTTTVNEITRFLVKFKQGQIDDVDPQRMVDWMEAIKPGVWKKMHKTLVTLQAKFMKSKDLQHFGRGLKGRAKMFDDTVSGDFKLLHKSLPLKDDDKAVKSTTSVMKNSVGSTVQDTAQKLPDAAAAVAIVKPRAAPKPPAPPKPKKYRPKQMSDIGIDIALGDVSGLEAAELKLSRKAQNEAYFLVFSKFLATDIPKPELLDYIEAIVNKNLIFSISSETSNVFYEFFRYNHYARLKSTENYTKKMEMVAERQLFHKIDPGGNLIIAGLRAALHADFSEVHQNTVNYLRGAKEVKLAKDFYANYLAGNENIGTPMHLSRPGMLLMSLFILTDTTLPALTKRFGVSLDMKNREFIFTTKQNYTPISQERIEEALRLLGFNEATDERKFYAEYVASSFTSFRESVDEKDARLLKEIVDESFKSLEIEKAVEIYIAAIIDLVVYNERRTPDYIKKAILEVGKYLSNPYKIMSRFFMKRGWSFRSNYIAGVVESLILPLMGEITKDQANIIWKSFIFESSNTDAWLIWQLSYEKAVEGNYVDAAENLKFPWLQYALNDFNMESYNSWYGIPVFETSIWKGLTDNEKDTIRFKYLDEIVKTTNGSVRSLYSTTNALDNVFEDGSGYTYKNLPSTQKDIIIDLSLKLVAQGVSVPSRCMDAQFFKDLYAKETTATSIHIQPHIIDSAMKFNGLSDEEIGEAVRTYVDIDIAKSTNIKNSAKRTSASLDAVFNFAKYTDKLDPIIANMHNDIIPIIDNKYDLYIIRGAVQEYDDRVPATVKRDALKAFFETIDDSKRFSKNTSEYREMIASLQAKWAELSEENRDMASEIYDSVSFTIKKRLSEQYIQRQGFKATVDAALTTGVIAPYEKLTPERIKAILKYNNVTSTESKLSAKILKSLDSIDAYLTQLNDGKIEPLEGLKVTTVDNTPDSLLFKTATWHKTKRSNRHGKVGMKILREFNVAVPIQVEEQAKFLALHPDGEILNPAFHGTGSVAASMILRYGFRVLSAGDSSVVGRMLGDGIYLSIHIDKAQQYLGDTGGFTSRNPGLKGYMFEINGALGKKGKDYESAGLGGDGIRSPEWCVFDPNAQSRIIKAYEVELITERDMDRIISDQLNEDVSEDIMKSRKSFKKHLEEEVTYNNEFPSTFTFVSGFIPLDVELKNVVDFEDFKPTSSRVSLEPSAYGPTVVIRGLSQDYNILCSNVAEFRKEHPEAFKEFMSVVSA